VDTWWTMICWIHFDNHKSQTYEREHQLVVVDVDVVPCAVHIRVGCLFVWFVLWWRGKSQSPYYIFQ
jgi:hypothetical protein